MLWEAQDWRMDLYGVELKSFLHCDTLSLRRYTSMPDDRPIVFTSSSPGVMHPTIP
ncbi:hypothetical protein EJ08DRAFT_653833 [Tothia fuscella]|uniref:Uncharacterized protein n=1 Tax=Tothia fuscella TaxID=1048955 RepID=A0A9P4NGD1_9PEZI|nr:hypothetical protein EJ08DRAFT_653833 [Tothia fuscella]